MIYNYSPKKPRRMSDMNSPNQPRCMIIMKKSMFVIDINSSNYPKCMIVIKKDSVRKIYFYSIKYV